MKPEVKIELQHIFPSNCVAEVNNFSRRAGNLGRYIYSFTGDNLSRLQ